MKIKAFAIVAIASLTLMQGMVFGQSHSRTQPATQRQTQLGGVVQESQQVAMGQIDHGSWNGLLKKYVDESGAVDYLSWHASAEDSQALDQYISGLSFASLKKPAAIEDQKAYWINAYNAVTIKGILQEYPTTSIRNHTSETGGYNLWKNLLLNVGGHQVSLDSMEHKILRPMGDPRIHFAIVCASKGCPRLLNQAYVGQSLEQQLKVNTTHFFSVAQNFQYDAANRVFKLSSIMEWFGSDFGADQAAQLAAISPYLPTAQAQAAARANAVRVSYLDYSWDLNAQPKKMKQANGSGTKDAGMTKTVGSGMKKVGGSGSR